VVYLKILKGLNPLFGVFTPDAIRRQDLRILPNDAPNPERVEFKSQTRIFNPIRDWDYTYLDAYFMWGKLIEGNQ
jgi:hypothetical protein